jgi:2-desacetyl-2-hydroxyethyl bacteriochlorophyllide A dehydrogenase
MTMRAARYYGIEDVQIDEVPLPTLAPDEVLVRVAYAGICGSDLHVYAKGMFGIVPPMTMGHEFSGVVEAVGADVVGLQRGDHVVGDPRLGCEQCAWCHRGQYHRCAELAFVGEAMPGSYAEYIVLPERRLVPVSDSLDLRVAALVEPMAVALHAVDMVSEPGQLIAGIIGAGPVGLLTLLVALTTRPWRIRVADRLERRRVLAAELGAHEVLDDVATAGERWADVVFEAAGRQAAFAGGVSWLAPGGSMAVVGIYEEPIACDPTDIVVKEGRLYGVSAYERQDLVAAAVLLEEQAELARRVISDVLPLQKAREGLAACRAGAVTGKVLLDCGLEGTSQRRAD